MKIICFRAAGALFTALWFALVSCSSMASPESTTQAARAERLTGADRVKIQRVITLQIKAFERDDEALAFSYSTPEIRKYFGSSHSFMEMVRTEYTVLFKHVSREFLEAAIIDGEVIQPVRIVSREGEAIVALYSLERQRDREWRISGCELAPSTLQST